MEKNKGNWRLNVSISKLPKMLLVGTLLMLSSLTFAQTQGVPADRARMLDNNSITIRTGLHESYLISMAHFDFLDVQEAEAYFLARSVDYITFTVVDIETVYMNFDLTHPAVAGWTLADWNQALATRAANSAPRTTSGN